MDYRDFQAGATKDHFWFKAKTLLIDVLLKKLPHQKDLKILNIGVGVGDDLDVIAQYGDIHALDIDQNALDLIVQKRVVKKTCADACQLPYPENAFDLVVSFDVMEHVENDNKMAEEIFRVLKPQGHYIFTVPAYNFLFSAHDRALHHFRRYTKKSVHKVLYKFEKCEAGYWVFFLFLPAVIKRLLDKQSETTQVSLLPSVLNAVCFKVLQSENWLISKGIRFPFGLTVYGIYQKK